MHGLEQPAVLENLCWTESWESGSQIWGGGRRGGGGEGACTSAEEGRGSSMTL